MATVPAPHDDSSSEMDPFTYDYDTLRTVGMVLAICMFVLGIVIALSKKCKCKKSDPSLSDPREAGKTSTPAGSV
ncbi:FXYD domain-containing ion transport regulator 7-like [Sphaerodactylus townsendi]|uniref:FXYD domain-containing ion transport regulator 7-like n=1 Tax=Sphaerodactylus townsendi TaxID=933632 RepID=UPI0020275BAC|nr:FXYD domain-containing ion transport regulator 7-like [Sphaerodactylus townsendi]